MMVRMRGNENLARRFGLPDTHGVLVAEVEPDSPARQAGIEAGDFIIAVDDKTVENPSEFRNRVAGLQSGYPVRLDLCRQGRKMAVATPGNSSSCRSRVSLYEAPAGSGGRLNRAGRAVFSIRFSGPL